MRVGIIGDVHIGGSLNLGITDPTTQLNSRLLDYEQTFNRIVDKFKVGQVDHIVLTGDIFETRHPTAAQLNVFSKCIRRAVDLGFSIDIVVGNHDQQRAINSTTVDVFASLKLDKVNIYSELNYHSLSPDLHLILMPYRDKKMLNCDSLDDAFDILRDQVSVISSQLSGKKILVGHYMLEKYISNDLPENVSLNELSLPLNIFDDLDVVVMGHIHGHSIVSKKPLIIYSGSMEKVSFGEKDHIKVSLILDENNLSQPEIITNDVRALHEININLKEKDAKETSENEILKAIDEYDAQNPLKDTIVRVVIDVEEKDNNINHKVIRDYIIQKGIFNLHNIQINIGRAKTSRSNLNEQISPIKAIADYIENLAETPTMKKNLKRVALEIIGECSGDKK